MVKVKVKTLLIISLLAVLVFIPTVFLYAEESLIEQEIIQQFQEIISQLKEQITQLQIQIQEFISQQVVAPVELTPEITEPSFTQTLRQGSIGEEVTKLQEFLAQYSEIYPEGLVTGYFGLLTKAAVQRFQEKYGIVSFGSPDTTGYGQIGPLTRVQLNESIAEEVISQGLSIVTELTTTTTVSEISPESATTTTEAVVATTTPTTEATTTSTTEATTTPSTGDGGGGGTISPGGGVAPPAAYCGDGSCNGNELCSTCSQDCGICPFDDTTPPTRSNGQPTGILSVGTTETNIFIQTDENAICKYSVTTGISYSVMTNTFSSTGTTTHSTQVLNLTNGSSYNYYIKCRDSSGNANSDDYTIGFSVAADTTPPAISSLTATNITTTSANITWITNESASGDVYYDISTPVNFASATKVSGDNNITSHSVSLISLTADTTYYYAAVSTDDSNNTTTSSEQSFNTLSLDTTPPVISEIYTIFHYYEPNVFSVCWETDELSSIDYLYVNTSTPVDLTTAIKQTASNTGPRGDGKYTHCTPYLLTRTDEYLIEEGMERTNELYYNTTYYFLFASTDLSGNTSTSTDDSHTLETAICEEDYSYSAETIYSFITTYPPYDEPVITNIQESNLTTSSITITYDIEDAGPLWDPVCETCDNIDYGLVPEISPGWGYDGVVSSDITGSAPYFSRSTTITSLSPGTTYYYRIWEENKCTNNDVFVSGPSISFTTLSE